jgi:hypothetical protein
MNVYVCIGKCIYVYIYLQIYNTYSIFFRPKLPDDMLYTIGLDVAPTDLVCVSLPNPYPNPISLLSNYSVFAQPKLPHNILYNIGLDVAPTDLVCISPPNPHPNPNPNLISLII